MKHTLERKSLTCVCISDTHGLHSQLPVLPKGDVLIHAGDCLGNGSVRSLESFAEWFESQPHKHKILVAGNHDRALQNHPELIPKLLPTTHYLQDNGIEIGGVKFWGSPWTPRFHSGAFMLDRGWALEERWSLIPDDTNVLVTHGPPHLTGDLAIDGTVHVNVGCEALLDRTRDLPMQVHVFGHIHEGYGLYQRGAQRLINACSCTEYYEPTNHAVVFTLDTMNRSGNLFSTGSRPRQPPYSFG